MKKENLCKLKKKAAQDKTASGKICEAFYTEINGSRQWITISGNDRRNPVMLYLHGGPGAPTSAVDYVSFREITDLYTVVSWDQRNCGKSRSPKQDNIRLTPQLYISDGIEMTRFILDYLDKEKLTLFGISWGSLLGANMALAQPKLFDAFIAASLHADWHENEDDIRRRALQQAEEKHDKPRLELAMRLNPDTYDEEHYSVRNKLISWLSSFAPREPKHNLAVAMLFSPFYSLKDAAKYVSGKMYPKSAVEEFLYGGGMAAMSLKGRTEYSLPFYLIQARGDVITGYDAAKKYFDCVKSPDKHLVSIQGGHTSLMTCPGMLRSCIDEIHGHIGIRYNKGKYNA